MSCDRKYPAISMQNEVSNLCSIWERTQWYTNRRMGQIEFRNITLKNTILIREPKYFRNVLLYRDEIGVKCIMSIIDNTVKIKNNQNILEFFWSSNLNKCHLFKRYNEQYR